MADCPICRHSKDDHAGSCCSGPAPLQTGGQWFGYPCGCTYYTDVEILRAEHQRHLLEWQQHLMQAHGVACDFPFPVDAPKEEPAQ